MALTLPVAEMPEVTPEHQVMAEAVIVAVAAEAVIVAAAAEAVIVAVAAEAVIAEAAAEPMMTVRSIRKPEAVM